MVTVFSRASVGATSSKLLMLSVTDLISLTLSDESVAFISKLYSPWVSKSGSAIRDTSPEALSIVNLSASSPPTSSKVITVKSSAVAL